MSPQRIGAASASNLAISFGSLITAMVEMMPSMRSLVYRGRLLPLALCSV